jgi:hypothetical protein
VQVVSRYVQVDVVDVVPFPMLGVHGFTAFLFGR